MKYNEHDELVECEQHVPTTRDQYKKAVQKILKANPTLTIAELAKQIGKTEEWLNAALS